MKISTENSRANFHHSNTQFRRRKWKSKAIFLQLLLLQIHASISCVRNSERLHATRIKQWRFSCVCVCVLGGFFLRFHVCQFQKGKYRGGSETKKRIINVDASSVPKNGSVKRIRLKRVRRNISWLCRAKNIEFCKEELFARTKCVLWQCARNVSAVWNLPNWPNLPNVCKMYVSYWQLYLFELWI